MERHQEYVTESNEKNSKDWVDSIAFLCKDVNYPKRMTRNRFHHLYVERM